MMVNSEIMLGSELRMLELREQVRGKSERAQLRSGSWTSNPLLPWEAVVPSNLKLAFLSREQM